MWFRRETGLSTRRREPSAVQTREKGKRMRVDVSMFRVKEAGSSRGSFLTASFFLGRVGARCSVREGEEKLLKDEPQAWRQ